MNGLSLRPVQLLFGEGNKPLAVTPKGFSLLEEPVSNKKVAIRVTADEVDFSRPLEPTFVYWTPPAKAEFPLPHRFWTQEYIGTDQAFFNEGYRWGVSLGGTPEEFERSPLYLPGGKINLPDGKYVIAIRSDEQGKVEVVLGKEDRGADRRVIEDFIQGDRPVTNHQKEIMGVSNHSMLVSRGLPFSEEESNRFSAVFAGEVFIDENEILYINDQSGQFFGPKGLTRPPQGSDENIPDGDKVMKQADYEDNKSAALAFAKKTLEGLTGQENIYLIKVVFEDQNLTADQLGEAREVVIKQKHAGTLKACLKDADILALLDIFDADPERQTRLVTALSKNGKLRHGILDLTNRLVARGTLKPEQGAKLALELFVEPKAIGFFIPASPLFIDKISDNTKRKVVASFNKLNVDGTEDFGKLIEDIKYTHPVLSSFLIGKRIAGGFLKMILADPERGARASQEVLALLKPEGCSSPETMDKLDIAPRLGSRTEFLFRVGHMRKKIAWMNRRVDKRLTKGKPVKTEVVLLSDPFAETTRKGLAGIHPNLDALRELQSKGVTLYRDVNTEPEGALYYMNHLFALAHHPMTAEDMMLHEQMERVLTAYGVDWKDFQAFVRKKFKSRWTDDLISAAYGKQHSEFRRFLQDLTWFRDLPQVDL